MDNLVITRANLMDSIEALQKLGFKRWTKNGMDRLYINADALGLDCSRATFDGEKISNSRVSEMRSAKTYIDLVNFKIVSDNYTLSWKCAELIGVDYDCGHKTFDIV